MSALIIPPGFVNAFWSFEVTGDPEPMLTSLAWEIDTPPFDQTDANNLINLFGAELMDALSSSYSLTSGFVVVGNDGDPIRFDVTVSPAVGGGQGASCCPQNVAYLIRKNTGSGGRRNRGRMYLPGVAEANVDNAGRLGGATVSNINGFLAAGITAAVPAANVTGPVLLHSSEPADPTPITGLATQSLVATQRRRLRR